MSAPISSTPWVAQRRSPNSDSNAITFSAGFLIISNGTIGGRFIGKQDRFMMRLPIVEGLWRPEASEQSAIAPTANEPIIAR